MQRCSSGVAVDGFRVKIMDALDRQSWTPTGCEQPLPRISFSMSNVITISWLAFLCSVNIGYKTKAKTKQTKKTFICHKEIVMASNIFAFSL